MEKSQQVNTFIMHNTLNIDDKRLGIKCQITYQLVNPEVAKLMLSKQVADNRKLSPYRVRRFKDLILFDEFHHYSMLEFNEQDELVNGQHRLTALVALNQTYGFIILKRLKG